MGSTLELCRTEIGRDGGNLRSWDECLGLQVFIERGNGCGPIMMD